MNEDPCRLGVMFDEEGSMCLMLLMARAKTNNAHDLLVQIMKFVLEGQTKGQKGNAAD